MAASLVQLTLAPANRSSGGLNACLLGNLARSCEEEMKGPSQTGLWLKPVSGCSLDIGSDMHVMEAVVCNRKYNSSTPESDECSVHCLAAIGHSGHFVSGTPGDERGEEGMLRVHEIAYLTPVLEHEADAEVDCVSVARKEGEKDSFLIFFGTDYGSVCAREVSLVPGQRATDEGSVLVGKCGGPVLHLVVSNCGALVAAGCLTGTVSIYKRQYGDAALPYKLLRLIDLSIDLSLSFPESGTSSHSHAVPLCGDLGGISSVAVSAAGDLVVTASESANGAAVLAFWKTEGSRIEGNPARYACGEDGATLDSVFLSEDQSSLVVVFRMPTGYEVWDVASRRRRSPHIAISFLVDVLCSTGSSGGQVWHGEGNGSRDRLFVGGRDENRGYAIAACSTGCDPKLLSLYPISSMPTALCCTSFNAKRGLLVGCEDGFVRMLDIDRAAMCTEPEQHQESARATEAGATSTPESRKNYECSAVAVMPDAGLVVAGHACGFFSLWRAESGTHVRDFRDEKGQVAMCYVLILVLMRA